MQKAPTFSLPKVPLHRIGMGGNRFMPVQSVVSRINRQLGDVDFGTGTCGPGSHRKILENTCPASRLGPFGFRPKIIQLRSNQETSEARSSGIFFCEIDRTVSEYPLTLTTKSYDLLLIFFRLSRKTACFQIRLRSGQFAFGTFPQEGPWVHQNSPAFSLPKRWQR